MRIIYYIQKMAKRAECYIDITVSGKKEDYMKPNFGHKRHFEKGMLAGILSAVVLTASVNVQVIAADGGLIAEAPQGAVVEAAAAENVQALSQTVSGYTEQIKTKRNEAVKKAEEKLRNG